MDYKSKYLKYKQKYLKLKGGLFNVDDLVIYKTKLSKVISITHDGNYNLEEIDDTSKKHNNINISELSKWIDERSERIKKRTQNPKELIVSYLKTNNFDENISRHINFVKKEMIENPYEIYLEFRNRLEKEGADANFPEFEGVIGYLTKSIFQDPKITTFFERPEYIILLEQLINKLLGIQIEGRFNYPYRATIYCIESMLELIDFYYRTTNVYDESKPVNENIGPYYHIFRYRSYMTTFTDSEYGIPNNIIFPTIANIGATDLIKIRCVPILIMGVVNEPIYVDQYLNSPLDFWAHDIQHAKRQIQETLRYYDTFIKHNQYYQRRTLFDIRTELQFYKYMNDFTKEVILPIIEKNKSDNEEVKAIKSIMKLIIFEVVHEKAWPITKKSLCRNIPLRYDEFPVENITLSDNKITTFHYLFADPTTIANVIGKIRVGFYDKVTDPKAYVVPYEYRTSVFVAKAANELLRQIRCKNIPSEDYILALTKDRHAMQEYVDLKSIDLPDNPPHDIPYPEHEPNLFDETYLYPMFKPKIDVTDVKKQDELHKLGEVLGYDPTFEQLGE